VVQAAMGGSVGGALAGAAAPYLAQEIKLKTEGDPYANLMAHAVLGAVLARAGGNSALAGAAGAVAAEKTAQLIKESLYGGVSNENLSEAQKQTISSLSTLAAGLSGSLVGKDALNAVAAAQVGKNAVENNLLANKYGVKKLDKASLELYEKLKEADIGSIDDLQKRYKGCAGDGACERDIRNEYRNQENEAGKKLLGLYQIGKLTRDEYNVFVADYSIAMLEGVKEGQRNGEGAGFLDIYSLSGADWAPAGVIGNPYVDAIRASEKIAEWKRQGLSDEKIVTRAQLDGLIGSNLAPVDVPGVINLVDNGASREEVLKFAAAIALGKALGGTKGTGTGKAPYTSTVSPDAEAGMPYAHPVKEPGAKDAVPQIKAGAAGGETAGKAFPQAVKDAAKAENPRSTCVYCRIDGTGTQVDHAIPKARGGDATLENAQMACPHCNASKGARDFPVNPPPGYRGEWPPSHW